MKRLLILSLVLVHAQCESSAEARAEDPVVEEPIVEEPAAEVAEPTSERLRERFATYRELRLADDWKPIYRLTDPDHREVVDEATFLQYYGMGYLEVLELELLDVGLSRHGPPRGATRMRAKVQLHPQKVPGIDLRHFKHSPEDLVKTAEVDIHWRFVDGDWFFAMEDEIVTGMSNGERIQPMRPKDG